MILRVKVWFNENWHDLPEKWMIYREKVIFNEKGYDLVKNEWFTEILYDLTRKGMI